MTVYRYTATKLIPEEYTEWGIVVAKDKDGAKAKLNQESFSKVHLKQIRGLAALWHGFTADIK